MKTERGAVPPPFPKKTGHPIHRAKAGYLKWLQIDFIWQKTKPFLFEIDAEWVHRIFFVIIRFLLLIGASKRKTRKIFQILSSSEGLAHSNTEAMGLTFRNPVGLAAGFDKNAEIIPAVADFGFGFIEIGTVTPRPQAGNLKPRLFRDPSQEAIFNRMGFNGSGMIKVRKNLEKGSKKLPKAFRIGVNVGKNKDTSNEEAALDYVKVVETLKDLADYLVINVSSPNTPGLRALQSVENLKPIVQETLNAAAKWSTPPAVLLKLAPELESKDLGDVVRACEKWGIGGFVLTNTLGGIWGPTGQPGGWSGQILSEKSKAALIEARSVTKLPIISVGGIGTPEQAEERIQLGANLIQFYSGWIYGGPDFPAKIVSFLAKK